MVKYCHISVKVKRIPTVTTVFTIIQWLFAEEIGQEKKIGLHIRKKEKNIKQENINQTSAISSVCPWFSGLFKSQN